MEKGLGKRVGEEMHQITVVGAGAVGGFFGARLAQAHPHVSFLLRPSTAEVIKRNGLTIRSTSLGTFTVHPRVTSDPKELSFPDLIILGVKAYDLDEACRQIEPVVGDETTILTLQNGVTSEDEIIQRFGRERVLGGVAFIYSKILEPGVIEHYTRGTVMVGELMGNDTPRLQHLVDLFQKAGVPCQVSEDIRKTKWDKMCWNCVFNPLTVLINDRVSEALDRPEMKSVISTIVSEVSAVAMAHRLPLDDDIADKVIRWSQEIRDIHTSMYDDWKAGRPTEIDYLNGYIAKKGKEFGIPTPLNEALTAIVKVITEQSAPRYDTLQIDGDVIQPLTLDGRALATLPTEYQVLDVGDVSPGLRGTGIRLKGLLEKATMAGEPKYATFHSRDGKYSACLTLEQAREYGILIYELDGEPLPLQKGGPFRLITPGLGDLCANVKQVARMELTKEFGNDTRPSKVCS
jgi:2-dehydropantoate 2-reductase